MVHNFGEKVVSIDKTANGNYSTRGSTKFCNKNHSKIAFMACDFRGVDSFLNPGGRGAGSSVRGIIWGRFEKVYLIYQIPRRLWPLGLAPPLATLDEFR